MTKPTSKRPSTTPVSKQSVRVKKATLQDKSATKSKTKALTSTKVHKPERKPTKKAVAKAPAKKAAPRKAAAPPAKAPPRRWTPVAPVVPREEPAKAAGARAIADLGDAPHTVTVADLGITEQASTTDYWTPATELARDRATLGLNPDGTTRSEHDPSIHERPAFKPTVERFIDEYMLSLNATEAYSKAHPTAAKSTCQVEGSKTLSNPMVAAEVARRRKELQERTGVTVEKLVARLWAIASANPNELTSWRVACCRYCWGAGHRKQRTDGEYARDLSYFEEHGHLPIRAKRKGEKAADYDAYVASRQAWDEEGGPGYDKRRAPHVNCPECIGEGQGRLVLGDSRAVSAEAAALFAGVRETKEGLEIKLHNQLDALEKLMRHLGAYERDNKQKGEGQIAALLAGFNKTNALPVAQDVPPEAAA